MKVLGFFCEGIRAETAGTESIVGVFPDNINLPSVPGMLPKLGIYLRIQFDLNEPPIPFKVELRAPWGETLSVGDADTALIELALKGARESKLPYAGIILRAQLAPFPIKEFGLITAVAIVGGQEVVCAILNLRQSPDANVSASQPRASQLPPAFLGT